MLTLRDSEGAFPAQGLSPGINNLRNCIYFRLGNRGTLFVRGCKTKYRLRRMLSFAVFLVWASRQWLSFSPVSSTNTHAVLYSSDHRETEWMLCYAYRYWVAPLGLPPIKGKVLLLRDGCGPWLDGRSRHANVR